MPLLSDNKKKTGLFIGVVIGLVSLAYYLAYYKYFRIDVDEGLLLNGALRVMSGQLPLRDFHQYMPGQYYLLAFWFFLFGKSIAVERLLFVALHTLKNILAFHVAKKIMPLPFSLIPSLLLLLLPGFWIKAFVGSILLINICLLLKYINVPKTKNLVFLGIATGLSVYFREDTAGYSFVTVALMILIIGIANKTKFIALLKRAAVYAGAVTAALAPLFFYYLLRNGISALATGIYQTVRLGHVESFDIYSPAVFFKTPLEIHNRDLQVFFSYAAMLLFLGMGYILVRRFRKKSETNLSRDLSLTAVLIMAGLSFIHIWHWTNEYRNPQTGALIHILWAYALYLALKGFVRWIKEKKAFALVKSGAYVTIFLFAVATQIWFVIYSFFGHPMVEFDAAGISLKRGIHRKIEGTDKADILPPIEQAVPYSRLLKYVADHTTPKDRILCFGESPIYFLSDRKNATEFDNGRIPAYFPKQRARFLGQIRANKPKVILIRKWEYQFWYPKMPEVFEAIIHDYFLETQFFKYYIFGYVTDLSDEIRQGNYLFFKGDVEGSTLEYRKALQKNSWHSDLRKIMTKLLFSKVLEERSLPALDGYAINMNPGTWEVRWGSLGHRRFSGTIRFAKDASPDKSLVRISPLPQNSGPAKVAIQDNIIRFESDINNSWAGFDLTFADSPSKVSVLLDFRQDNQAIQEIFLSNQGLVRPPEAFFIQKRTGP